MSELTTEARHETLPGLIEMLKGMQDWRLDAVVPGEAITSREGTICVAGLTLTDEARLAPTEDAYSHVAEKIGMPITYMRKLVEKKRTDLIDANVNGWLHGSVSEFDLLPIERQRPGFGPDTRKFLVRGFVKPGETEGTLRAMFSNKYGIVDDLDAAMATLDGIKASGEEVEVVECNRTERQLSMSFAAPGILAAAPTLLNGYRPPDGVRSWQGRYDIPAGEEPVVFAGFKVKNSETGWCKLHVEPEVRVRICGNGLTMNVLGAGFQRIHLGATMGDGVIDWSQTTMRKQLELIKTQATDAVRAFLTPETLAKAVGWIEERAGAEVKNMAGTVEVIGKRFGFTEEEQATILNHFTQGGQATAGGLLNAITSTAQVVTSADRAEHLADKAVEIMGLVAASPVA